MPINNLPLVYPPYLSIEEEPIVPIPLRLGADVLGAIGLGSVPFLLRRLPAMRSIPSPLIVIASLIFGYAGARKADALVKRLIRDRIVKSQIKQIYYQKLLADQMRNRGLNF